MSIEKGNSTKLLILNEANRLFYRQGFASTSFSHIVDKTGLSKGNITYHFKNKQDILKGIIGMRLNDIEQLLKQWDKEISKPLDRLERFCEMLVYEKNNLVEYGCPMGTITGEFSKNQPELHQISLVLFIRFRTWITEQFKILNYTADKADENAMYLLSRTQGISVITHVFKDEAFLDNEVEKLKNSLRKEYG